MTPEEKARTRLADASMTVYRMGEIAKRNEYLVTYFDKDIGAAHAAVAQVARAEQGRLRELIEEMRE